MTMTTDMMFDTTSIDTWMDKYNNRMEPKRDSWDFEGFEFEDCLDDYTFTFEPTHGYVDGEMDFE